MTKQEMVELCFELHAAQQAQRLRPPSPLTFHPNPNPSPSPNPNPDPNPHPHPHPEQECLRLRAALRSFELRYPRAFVEPGESAEVGRRTRPTLQPLEPHPPVRPAPTPPSSIYLTNLN